MRLRYGSWLVFVVVAVLTVTTLARAEVGIEDTGCSQIRQQCRLETRKIQLDEGEKIFLNVSCFCENGEDVSTPLEEVMKVKCSWMPSVTRVKVDYSILHITGCSIQEKLLPSSVWTMLRQSHHLQIYVEGSPNLRLSPYLSTEGDILQELNATFIASKLSGLPEGVLGRSQVVQVVVERCELSVLDSRSFSGYSPNADVNVTLINTTINTMKEVAFDLPEKGVVKIKGGRVLAWERSGYSGGSHLNLDGVTIGRLMTGAINIHGLQSFEMTSCTVAEVSHEALKDMGFPQSQFVDNSATFRDNKFVSANGKAFVNLCSVEELVWHNNSFVNVTTPPIRLQEPECETKRDWHTNISLTGLSCLDCEDFRNSDEQTCAIYQSGYCTSCTEHFDNCYNPLLSYLILEQCQDSHPSIAAELAQNCNLDQSAKPQPRLLTGSATSLIPLSLLLVAGIFFSVIN